jgi:solute carrier family 25 protein 16
MSAGFPAILLLLHAGGEVLPRCFRACVQEHRVPPVLDLLAGSMAGGSAVLVTYPLDLVRTRLAYMTEAGAWPSQQPQRRGARVAAGWPSAALTGAARGSVAGWAGGGRPPLAHARAGGGGLALAGSRGVAAARLQGRGLHLLPRGLGRRHTIRSVLGRTLEREGLRGLYHGVGASLYGILPYAGLKFYCYQHLKQVRWRLCHRCSLPHAAGPLAVLLECRGWGWRPCRTRPCFL